MLCKRAPRVEEMRAWRGGRLEVTIAGACGSATCRAKEPQASVDAGAWKSELPFFPDGLTARASEVPVQPLRMC